MVVKNAESRVFDISELKVATMASFNYKKSDIPRESKMYGFLDLTPEHQVYGPKTYRDSSGQLQIEKEQVFDEDNNPVFDTDESGNKVPRLSPVYDPVPKKQVYLHLYQFRRPTEVNGRIVLADNQDISEEEIKKWLKAGTQISFVTTIHPDKGVFCLSWTCTHLIDELKIEIMNRPNWRVTAQIEKFDLKADNQSKAFIKNIIDRRLEIIYTGGDLNELRFRMNSAFIQASSGKEDIEFFFEKMENCKWIPCDNPLEQQPPKQHKLPAEKKKRKPVKKVARKAAKEKAAKEKAAATN